MVRVQLLLADEVVLLALEEEVLEAEALDDDAFSGTVLAAAIIFPNNT
jgi:hypothetical protein